MLENLRRELKQIGKPQWREMLTYMAELHERSIHEPQFPFSLPWEEIGPGYLYGPAFGHWDLVHQIMDTLPAEPEHAANQILNDLAAQEPDGLLPGTIWMREGAEWSKTVGHPPVWVVAAHSYYEHTADIAFIEKCFEPLLRQIRWFENNRNSNDGGYFYREITSRFPWESGIDHGIRFDRPIAEPHACVDATSHVYLMYKHAGYWADILNKESKGYFDKADAIRSFISNSLFNADTGYFYDLHANLQPEYRTTSFEGIWPVAAGIATKEQADRVIDEYMLNPSRFFTEHPMPAVSLDDPHFDMRMWRGPTWNSITYWAARGCMLYGRNDAAKLLLERALNAVSMQFGKTGTIWEFYHPHCGEQTELKRKGDPGFDKPFSDYLGHNPIIALARMWQSLQDDTSAR